MVQHVATILLLCALSSNTAAEGEISIDRKRFFTTPAERAQMDRARRDLGKKPVQAPVNVVVKNKPLPKVTVQGIVKRSSGEDTVWINGAGVEIGKRKGDVAVRSVRESGNARLLLSGEKAVTLKPGQSFDPNTDKVRDGVRVQKGR